MTVAGVLALPGARRPAAGWEASRTPDPGRAALPLHLHAAAAALFDDLPGSVPDPVAHAAVAGVESIRARLRSLVPAGAELLIDGYRSRLALACPASARPDPDGFRWTPATAARHLGLRALALHLCGAGTRATPEGERARAGATPSVRATAAERGAPTFPPAWPGLPVRSMPIELAVDTVIAEHIRNGAARSPGPWLAGLDPAGRAVAQAQAQRWAEQAADWLPLRLAAPGSLRFLADDWWPGGRGERTLVLHGRRDVTVDVARRRVAVTVAGGTAAAPGAETTDAVTALAATLCDPRGRLVRVVRVHPASGEVVATDVTTALVERGLQAVQATASALVSGASPTPGPGCTWCHRLASCPSGAAWLGRPGRRSMGLPLPDPTPVVVNGGVAPRGGGAEEAGDHRASGAEELDRGRQLGQDLGERGHSQPRAGRDGQAADHGHERVGEVLGEVAVRPA